MLFDLKSNGLIKGDNGLSVLVKKRGKSAGIPVFTVKIINARLSIQPYFNDTYRTLGVYFFKAFVFHELFASNSFINAISFSTPSTGIAL